MITNIFPISESATDPESFLPFVTPFIIRNFKISKTSLSTSHVSFTEFRNTSSAVLSMQITPASDSASMYGYNTSYGGIKMSFYNNLIWSHLRDGGTFSFEIYFPNKTKVTGGTFAIENYALSVNDDIEKGEYFKVVYKVDSYVSSTYKVVVTVYDKNENILSSTYFNVSNNSSGSQSRTVLSYYKLYIYTS